MPKPLKYKMIEHTVLPSGYPEQTWKDNFKARVKHVGAGIHTFRRTVRFAGHSMEIVIFAALVKNPDYEAMKDREKAERLARRQASLFQQEEGQ